MLTIEWFRSAQEHAGVLIVPYSLPNHRPERIARSLAQWLADSFPTRELAYRIDFLREG